MARISVVVPVYKAENTLLELYARLKTSIETVTSDFELVLVEDNGKDRSWAMIRELAASDKRVKGIQLSRNFGQHYAITAGLDYCDADWVVVMDCDLQDPPEEIPKIYAKAQEGFDIVLALRSVRKDSFIKKLLSNTFYRLFSYMTELPYDPRVRNYRIMSRAVVEEYRKLREQLRFFAALVNWLGFKVCGLELQHSERRHGESTYTFRKLWALAMDTLIAYSDKPLRLIIRLGFFIAGLSLIGGVYLLIRGFMHGFSVVGWGSLIVSLYFLSSVIIIVLGINGLYLGKLFNEAKRRPLYIIQEKI